MGVAWGRTRLRMRQYAICPPFASILPLPHPASRAMQDMIKAGMTARLT